MSTSSHRSRSHEGLDEHDLELIDTRYIVVPSLLWAAAIAAALVFALLGTRAAESSAAAPAVAVASDWGA